MANTETTAHRVIEAGDILPNGYRVIETASAERGGNGVVVLAYLSNHGSRESSSNKYAVWFADRRHPDSTGAGYYSPNLGNALAKYTSRIIGSARTCPPPSGVESA